MKTEIPRVIYEMLIDERIDLSWRQAIADTLGIMELPIKKNLYCPKCIEKEGEVPALENLKCPLCGTNYFIKNDKLYEQSL